MHAATPVKSDRRSPTAHELAVWRQFVETNEKLQSMLAAGLQSESGLSRGDYAVLLALTEAKGQRIRSSELADDINWERSRLSHHLGRMESRGLISRQRCATDSRGSEVLLTEAGASSFRRASAPHLRQVKGLFVDAFDSGLLEKVGEITRALAAHLERTGGVELADE